MHTTGKNQSQEILQQQQTEIFPLVTNHQIHMLPPCTFHIHWKIHVRNTFYNLALVEKALLPFLVRAPLAMCECAWIKKWDLNVQNISNLWD